MTQQQMENALNLIIEQQANFSVNMDLLKESQTATELRLKEILDVQSVHQDLLEKLTETSVKTFEAIAELIKVQKGTDEKLAETDERLNVLINIVENRIGNHNGNRGN